MSTPKYEYYLKTWGGFYNDHNLKIHGFSERGHRYFDTAEERDAALQVLEEACKKLGTPDACLARFKTEGYHVRTVPSVHRLSQYKGKVVHTFYSWSFPETDISVLLYYMEYKWYPNFNDYPFGEDFDYSDKEFKVLSEWVEGNFEPKQP